MRENNPINRRIKYIKDIMSPVLICECGNRYIKLTPKLFIYGEIQEKCLDCYRGKTANFRHSDSQ